MSDDLLTTIRLAFDGSEVSTGITSVKRSIVDLGTRVREITKTTNEQLKTIGDLDIDVGAKKATKALARDMGELAKEIASVGSSVQKEFKNIGKSAEQAYVELAGKGVPTAAIDSYVKLLKEAQSIAKIQAQTAAKSAAEQAFATQKLVAEEEHYAGLKKQHAAFNKTIADQEAASLREQKVALAAFRTEVQNAELNLTYFGRAKSAAFLQDKGGRLGFDPSIVQAEIAALQKLEAAQKAAFNQANPGIEKLRTQAEAAGTSIKGLNAGLRQVPAQFTDIIVSLQGGQAPLTVLLQQGGQLKDVFGGAGNAARALGGYVAGLVNPYTLLAGAVLLVGYAAYKSSEDAKALNKAIALAGESSGSTIGELSKVADGIKATGTSSGTATVALSAFVGAGVRAGDSLGEFVKSAIELERVGGPAVADTAKAFADLAKDPLAALEKVNLATYKQIEALLEQGDKLAAVKVAQEAFNETNKLATTQIEGQFGPLDRIAKYWKEVGVQAFYAAGGIAQALGFGSLTGNEQRSELKKKRDLYAAQGYDTTKEDAELAYYKRLDEAQAQQAKNLAKEIELKGLLSKFNSSDESTRRQTALNQGITDYGKLLDAQLISVPQYAAAIKKLSEVKEKSNSTGSAKLSDEIKGLNLYNDLVSKSVGFSADYAEKVGLLAAAFAKGRVSSDGLQAAIAQLNSEQALFKEAAKTSEDAMKAAAKAQDAYVNAQIKSIDAAEKSAKSAGDTLQKYLDEEAALTLSAEKNITLAQAVSEVELARLRESQASAIASNANLGVLLALDEEIKKREQIAQAIGRKESREANKKAADDVVKESKRAADQIEQSITDALFRGFESGKGFVESLRDTIVNTFKTMVLRPAVSAVVNPIAGAAASALGFSGAANAAGAAANGGLALSGGLAALGGTFGSSFAAGFSGTLTAGFAGLGATLSGGLSAIATGSASTMAAGLGQIAGALGPIALGVVGVASVFSALRGGSYVQSLGESVATVTADKLVKLGGSGGNNDVSIGGGLNIRQTETSDKFVSSLAATYLKATQALGITSAATFGAGFNNSDGGKFAVEAAVGGQKYDPGQVKYTDANLQLEASRAVFFALKSSTLPGYLSKVFDGINASTAAQADIDAALNYAGSLKQIRDSLTETREPLQILKDTVADSFAALGTSADTFKRDFVSAIDAGITPAKLDEYVKLGQNLDELAKASGTASSAVARSLADIANERKSLDERFAQATLSTEQLASRTRDAIDASNKSRYDEVIAVESAKAALDKLTATNAAYTDKLALLTGAQTDRSLQLRDATDASTEALLRQIFAQEDLNATAQQRTGIESALLQLQGNTAALRARELSALDPSNRALQEQVYLLQDVKAAQDNYNTTLSTAQSKFDSAANALRAAQDTARGLQEQATGAYVNAQDKVASAQQRIADIQLSALKKTQQAAFDAAQNLQALGKTLAEFVDGKTLKADQTFADTLKKALAGDTQAMQGLSGAASAASDLAAERSVNVALAQARIMADVMRVAQIAASATLPGVIADADPMVAAVAELATARAGMAEALRVVNAIGASTTASVSSLIGQYGGAVQAITTAQVEFNTSRKVLEDIRTATQATATALAGIKISGTGGTAAGAAQYTGAYIVQAVNESAARGASPADIISGAQAGFGVSSADLARVATAAASNAATTSPALAAISAYQRRIDATAVLGASEREGVVAEANRRAMAANSSVELEMYRWLKELGWNAGMADKAMGWASGTSNAWATANGYAAFANGGAFTNGIVSRPTNFPMGQMGEAGPEAIMPLANINGALGVRFAGNTANDALVAEIRGLRESNERLEKRLANIEAATNSSATSNALTADSTRRMDLNGVMVYTDPAEPLKTKEAA